MYLCDWVTGSDYGAFVFKLNFGKIEVVPLFGMTIPEKVKNPDNVLSNYEGMFVTNNNVNDETARKQVYNDLKELYNEVNEEKVIEATFYENRVNSLLQCISKKEAEYRGLIKDYKDLEKEYHTLRNKYDKLCKTYSVNDDEDILNEYEPIWDYDDYNGIERID